MGVKKGNRTIRRQWSKKDKDADIGFWNPWSYSNVRHEYCKDLNLDILGLGELHNAHDKEQFKEKR